MFPPGVKVAQSDQPQQQPAIGNQRPPSSTQQQQQQQQQQTRPTASSVFPGSLQDLVVSFENVKQKGSLSMP
jgi:CCR4-NOT transcription complex subunit 3